MDQPINLAIQELTELATLVDNMVNSIEESCIEDLPKCVEDVYYKGKEMKEFGLMIKGEL